MSNDSFNTAIPPGVVSAETFASVDGLEFLQRIRDGRFPPPPIAALLGFYPIEVESGRAVFAARPDSRLYNPMGAIHGGYMATLLDSCMGCAVHSKLKAGQGYTTVELKVSYVRPLTEETGEVRAEGKIIHHGRQIATADGRLTDSRGRLLAHASTTCLIFNLPKPDVASSESLQA
ncbi:MAG: PaaI family thioesterase [Rhizobiales bacterium]|nr:PaaI family thioesterase [Hyphomicrobiales bacterium]